MVGRNLSERERRELADAHRGEVVIESAERVEPRRLGQMVSLRLEADTIEALRDIANRRGMTLSDLLREGARILIAADQSSHVITDLSYVIRWLESPSDSGSYGQAVHSINPSRLDEELPITA
jgi:predicted DNA-binding ribbon-helix-helix protein